MTGRAKGRFVCCVIYTEFHGIYTLQYRPARNVANLSGSPLGNVSEVAVNFLAGKAAREGAVLEWRSDDDKDIDGAPARQRGLGSEEGGLNKIGIIVAVWGRHTRREKGSS